MRRFIDGPALGDLGLWSTVSTTTNYNIVADTTSTRAGDTYGFHASRVVGFSGAGCYIAVNISSAGSNLIAPADPAGLGYARSLVSDGNKDRVFVRFYFKIATAPATFGAGFYLFRFQESGGTFPFSILYTSGGVIQMITGGSEQQVIFTPTVGTWYRLEIALGNTSAGSVMSAHAFTEDSFTPIGGGSRIYVNPTSLLAPRLGFQPVNTGLAGSGAVDIYFSTIGVNDNQIPGVNDNYLGPGKIVEYRPNADATPLDLTSTAGTHSTEVDDAPAWPPDGNTTTVTTPVTTSAVEDNYDFASYAGGANIKVVQAHCYYRNFASAVTLGTDHRAGIVDSGGTRLERVLPLNNDDNYRYAGTIINGTGANGNTAWTTSEFDNAATEILLRRPSVSALGTNQRLVWSGVALQVEDDDGLSGLVNPFTTDRHRPRGQVI